MDDVRDVVEALRDQDYGWTVNSGNLLDRAADEIEELRAEVARLKDVIRNPRPDLARGPE